MARVTAYADINLVDPDFRFGEVVEGDYYTITLSDGFHDVDFEGFGFSFFGDYVVSGTIESISDYDGSFLNYEIEDLYLPATYVNDEIANADLQGFYEIALLGNDEIYGSKFDDDLAGYAGNDFIDAGAGDDIIFGDAGNDVILAGDGADDVYGGSGTDFAEFDGFRSEFIVDRFDGGINVRSFDGFVDTQTYEVERLGFNNGVLALDVNGTAGQAYRLYQAAFDRTPDTGGVGFWIERMDDGQSLTSVANQFIGSAEFRSIYGTNPSIHDFVSRLYENVLGREGEAGGQAYWEGQLASGQKSAAEVLANFSESPENVANVAPIISDGFWYTT
jgi:hypothetical protein